MLLYVSWQKVPNNIDTFIIYIYYIMKYVYIIVDRLGPRNMFIQIHTCRSSMWVWTSSIKLSTPHKYLIIFDTTSTKKNMVVYSTSTWTNRTHCIFSRETLTETCKCKNVSVNISWHCEHGIHPTPQKHIHLHMHSSPMDSNFWLALWSYVDQPP